MKQTSRPCTAAVLALVGAFSLVPLSGLHAEPQARAPRAIGLLQRVEQQAASLLGGLSRVWEKVGARIDDNGFMLRLMELDPEEGTASYRAPTVPAK